MDTLTLKNSGDLPKTSCPLCGKPHDQSYNQRYEAPKNFGISWEHFQQYLTELKAGNPNALIDSMYYTDAPGIPKSTTKQYLDNYRKKGFDETTIQLAAEQTIEKICTRLASQKICYGNLNGYFNVVLKSVLEKTPLEWVEPVVPGMPPAEPDDDERIIKLTDCLKQLYVSKQLQAEILQGFYGFEVEAHEQQSETAKFKRIAEKFKVTYDNARKLAERGREQIKKCMSKK